MKLPELPPEKNILVMAESGKGKTHLVGTLAEIMPTVVVTADPAGLETLRKMSLKPETEILTISDWGDIWQHYKQIARLSQSMAALALDDFGALQIAARHHIERVPRAEEIKRTGDVDTAIREQLMLGQRRMQIQQWGEIWIALESFLHEVLKLPYKVRLVTVLEGKAINPRTGEEHIYPDLQGQMRSSLLARFSLVAEAFINFGKEGKGIFCLHSRPHPRIETKDRFQSGGRTWVNPTAAKLLLHITGGDEQETEQEKKIGAGI
jgi:hypothetical protein